MADIPSDLVQEFCRSFPSPEYYVSEAAVRDAIEHRFQFNIIHPDSGLKVDVIIPADTPFNRSRFSRKRRVHPGDYDASFAFPEDAILKKMHYYQEGGSDKHLRDITSVLKVSGPQIHRAYIQRWAVELGVADIWSSILSRLERQ